MKNNILFLVFNFFSIFDFELNLLIVFVRYWVFVSHLKGADKVERGGDIQFGIILCADLDTENYSKLQKNCERIQKKKFTGLHAWQARRIEHKSQQDSPRQPVVQDTV